MKSIHHLLQITYVKDAYNINFFYLRDFIGFEDFICLTNYKTIHTQYGVHIIPHTRWHHIGTIEYNVYINDVEKFHFVNMDKLSFYTIVYKN